MRRQRKCDEEVYSRANGTGIIFLYIISKIIYHFRIHSILSCERLLLADRLQFDVAGPR